MIQTLRQQAQRIRSQIIPQSDQFKINEEFDVVVSLEGEGSASDSQIDIIFVIDVSASMTGQKLELIKKSIILFSDLLRQKNMNNQISLVSFASSAQIVIQWTLTTDQNRKFIEYSINELRGGGGTNIFSGFQETMKLLKQRENRDSVTYVILLSDGFDDYGSEKCYQKVQSIIQNTHVPFIYGLLVLGYGMDQNVSLLNNISKLKSGLYYNIKNIYDAENCFHQLFQKIIETTFANIKVEIAPINPFEISSYDQNNFTQTDSSIYVNLELFKIRDVKDYFITLICKAENSQVLNEQESVNFMSTNLIVHMIGQNQREEERIISPQLTLCLNKYLKLELNPLFVYKQGQFIANQALNAIIEFEKKGQTQLRQKKAQQMLIRLLNSREPEVQNLADVFLEVIDQAESGNLLMQLIDLLPKVSGVQPAIEENNIQEFDNNYKKQLHKKNLSLIYSTKNPTSKFTEVEYNNLIMLNNKVVIVVYDKQVTKSKLKEIEEVFQNIQYQDIKFIMIDRKYHNFLDYIINQSDLSILFYNEHKLRGTLQSPQYINNIAEKLSEYCNNLVIDSLTNRNNQSKLPIQSLYNNIESSINSLSSQSRLLVFYYQPPEMITPSTNEILQTLNSEVEYNNLIMQSNKVVIVVYKNTVDKLYLQEIEILFEQEIYQDIILCMINEANYYFQDQTLISDLSILFYNQHELKGSLQSSQSYTISNIKNKLVEYEMCEIEQDLY